MKKLFAISLLVGLIALSALALWTLKGHILGNAHEALAACVALAMIGFAAMS